jgi:hypothetical protein
LVTGKWPLLTVEIEVMGIQSVQMKEVLPWFFRWACRAGTRDFCYALAALIGPVQNIIFLIVTLHIQFLCPHRPATLAGSRAGSPTS